MDSGITKRTYWWVIWLAVIGACVAVALSGTFAAVATPGCESCHSKGTFKQQTDASAHAQVACADCHVPEGAVDRLGFGYRQVFHMAVPAVGGNDRQWAAVSDDTCLKCHKSVTQSVVEANGIRIDHAVCADDSQCTDCHSTVAHGTETRWARTYDMETCLACHASKGISECSTCHASKRPANRITSGVFAVTHGADWQKTHGMGNSATCTACHTGATCVKCHGEGLPHEPNFVETHSEIANGPNAKCESCHEQSFCDSCHGVKMPHDRKFTRSHAKIAEQDPEVCKRCHVESDCKTCHVTHVHPGGAVDPDAQVAPWKTGGK